MLDNIWKHYMQCANSTVPNWKSMNKNDLINDYIKYENNSRLKQGYMAAIICRYWPSLLGYINKCYLNVAPEELYDAFIEAIIYSLNKRAWLNEKSSVYNDPNGPDKCINIKLKYMIWNCEFSQSRMKRQINQNIVCSTDDDQVHVIGKVSDDIKQLEINDLIHDRLKSNDYISALIIYYILYGDVFDNGSLNEKKLCKRLRNFDSVEQLQFKSKFNLNSEKLDDIINYVQTLSTRKLYNRISIFLQKGKQYAY